MHCEYRPRSGSPLAPSRFLVRTAMAARSQSESERETVYTSIHDMQLIHVSNILDKCLDGGSSRINVGSPQYPVLRPYRHAFPECYSAVDVHLFTLQQRGGRRRESKERESKYV